MPPGGLHVQAAPPIIAVSVLGFASVAHASTLADCTSSDAHSSELTSCAVQGNHACDYDPVTKKLECDLADYPCHPTAPHAYIRVYNWDGHDDRITISGTCENPITSAAAHRFCCVADQKNGYDVKELVVRGTEYADELIALRYVKNGYEFELQPMQGTTLQATVYGNGGSDSIHGSDVASADYQEFLYGNAGVDKIRGFGGEDKIYGGTGGDFLYGGDHADYIHGGTEDDFIYGDDGDDELRGGDGVDTIEGGEGADQIWGNLKGDDINGGPGDDEIRGGDGDDVIRGGPDNDKINGQNGVDEVFGDGGHDWLAGGIHLDHVHGGEGDDVICEDQAASYPVSSNQAVINYLYGDGGNDTVYYGAWASPVVPVIGGWDFEVGYMDAAYATWNNIMYDQLNPPSPYPSNQPPECVYLGTL